MLANASKKRSERLLTSSLHNFHVDKLANTKKLIFSKMDDMNQNRMILKQNLRSLQKSLIS